MGASTSRGQVEDVGRALAVDPIASILQRYSDALIPEARCRAARLCLEGSKSRNRLSEVPAWPVLFFCRESWAGTARAGHTERSPQSILSRSPPCELSASVSALFRWAATGVPSSRPSLPDRRRRDCSAFI